MKNKSSRLARFLMIWVPVTIIELIFSVSRTQIPVGSLAGLVAILLVWKAWRARGKTG